MGARRAEDHLRPKPGPTARRRRRAKTQRRSPQLHQLLQAAHVLLRRDHDPFVANRVEIPRPMRRGGDPSNLRVIRTARVERWLMPALMPCIRTGTKQISIPLHRADHRDSAAAAMDDRGEGGDRRGEYATWGQYRGSRSPVRCQSRAIADLPCPRPTSVRLRFSFRSASRAWSRLTIIRTAPTQRGAWR